MGFSLLSVIDSGPIFLGGINASGIIDEEFSSSERIEVDSSFCLICSFGRFFLIMLRANIATYIVWEKFFIFCRICGLVFFISATLEMNICF